MGEFTIWQRRPCFPVLFEKFCIILIRPCTFVSLIAFLDLTLTTLIASVLIFLTDQQKRPVIYSFTMFEPENKNCFEVETIFL